MNLTDNLKLLRDYADRGEEEAFRELVERYIDLVYSTALRRVGDNADLAQDITQTVFADLARKARALRNVELLGGWLHRHTGFVASNILRKEQRRQNREQEAVQMNALNQSPDTVWQQMAPVLDETIEFLEPQDRQAILLRFFERHDFRVIGAMLGISDDAAQKRVSRALDKLRDLLAKRGVTLTVVLLGTLMAGKVVKAAPAGLGAKVAGLAVAGATGASGLVTVLAKVANSLAFKTGIAALVIAAGVKLLLSSHPVENRETVRQGGAGPPPVKTDSVSTAVPNSSLVAAPGAGAATAPVNATNGYLSLSIVADDTGQPVPDVSLDYWIWGDKVKHLEALKTTRSGTCEVPVQEGTTELILVSEVDGFADTRLEWHPDRGQKIPAQYTLRLARAVPIGGYVEDPDGKPLAGAQVCFGNQVDAALDSRIETEEFGWPFWIGTTTDADGHWRINRVGKEAIHTITGAASHADYVRSDQTHDSESEKQLLAGTYIFRLGKAVTVHGVVQDSNGQPIPQAKVLVGEVSEVNSRETTNQADGNFSVAGCKPGKTVITAEAKGYAATTLAINLSDNPVPVQLVLHTGALLRLKIVDANGRPVRGGVWLDPFRNMISESTSAPPAQVDFNRMTDADGRLEWDSAPDEVLSFGISAAGYMRLDDVEIRPDGNEHVLIMQPALTISGTVKDATTGEPIPQFHLATGWPVWNPVDNSTNAHWSTIDRFWLSFEGGKFHHVYEEPALGGTTDIEFMFKFEADGYAPFISRVVEASERDVNLDVALIPASSTVVSVLSPNGEPAAGAQVALVAPGTGLRLIPGGFSTENQSGGSLGIADANGQFELPPDPAITRVIAANPEGYVEATPAELAASRSLRLQPWGKLEGTYLSDGQPATDRLLLFDLARNHSDSISCDFMAFQTKTDGQGHFSFSRVPPGNHELILLEPGTDDNGVTYCMHQPLQGVTIQAGQTTTVTVGDTTQGSRNAARQQATR